MYIAYVFNSIFISWLKIHFDYVFLKHMEQQPLVRNKDEGLLLHMLTWIRFIASYSKDYGKSTNINAIIEAEKVKDPEFAKGFGLTQREYNLIDEMIKARRRKGLIE